MVHVHIIQASLGAAVAFAVLPERNAIVINSDTMPEGPDDHERRRMIADLVALFQRQQDRTNPAA